MAATKRGTIYRLTAADDEITIPFTADRIRWVSKGAAAGDDLSLVESSTGNTAEQLWESVASGPNYVEESLNGYYFEKGLRADVIDSGTLWVYIATGTKE